MTTTTTRHFLVLYALGAVILLGTLTLLQAEIPKPTDAPQPLAVEEAAREFRVPNGYRVEVVASEPLIHEPTGVCWDARGRMFVCELHGYNLAGQLDIEALNKTGQLDHIVRRLDADEETKKRARAETYGTVKQLVDSDGDGDGLMDKAAVWADRLPACHGVCAAGDGIIVTCAPDIIFLADRDGDGKAEVRELLFTGFTDDMLERSISAPQWGIDGWVYVGRGGAGCTVKGPHLKQPVELPYTDFRFKPDGSAIEPVTGSSRSMGFAITESGDRYVMNTNVPAIFAAPIPWHYLTRNPHVAVTSLDRKAADYNRAYPTSQPHPWRTRRADDPGFAKYFTKRYGAAEAVASGYFTSCCSPLVYQGQALAELNGQYLVCEPAQNLLHRGILSRDGSAMQMQRAPGEEEAEFLTSLDAWFHPIALAHGPDDRIYITDFYREIIEDYSAIPRYLQQQYELTHGQDRGRIWRLTHRDAPPAKPFDMSRLSAEDLAAELGSPTFWRRETARRLLVEQGAKSVAPELVKLASTSDSAPAILGALYALRSIGPIDTALLERMLAHPQAAVRVHAMRFADERLNEEPVLRETVFHLASDDDPAVLLQVALSLGEIDSPRVVPELVELAREHGDLEWMPAAILSSLSQHGGEALALLLKPLGAADSADALGKAGSLLDPLCGAIAARHDSAELSAALAQIVDLANQDVREACLRGLQRPLRSAVNVDLSDAVQQSLRTLADGSSGETKKLAKRLVVLFKVESAKDRAARLGAAGHRLTDTLLPTDRRLVALAELAEDDDPAITSQLLDALPDATPKLREAILNALFARRERLPLLLDAIEKKSFPTSALSAIQRSALLENPDEALRQRAQPLLTVTNAQLLESLPRFTAALKGPRDAKHGEKVFREKCATCHVVRGIGFAVGPDLAAEFQRAEETIVRDILSPSEAIAAGYVTYVVETTNGQILTGLIAGESANSITLRQPEGKEQSILRNEIAMLKSSPVSIMPEELGKTLTPQDVADAITWLRSPQ